MPARKRPASARRPGPAPAPRPAVAAARRERPQQDSYGATALGDVVDRSIHAAMARFTSGLSPAALAAACLDWAVHLAVAPGKQGQLVEKARRKAMRLAHYAVRRALGGAGEPCIEPLPQDRRFSAEAWRGWPFDLVWQGFLLQQQWWHNATTGVRGVTRQHEDVVSFAARQVLDMASPSNFVATNPELLQRTLRQGGMNLVRGAQNLVEDWDRAMGGRRPVGCDAFAVGRDVACTPGRVVFRNRLVEVIQYAPTTRRVRPEPVLVVPAWIMKYYILDLSPANSLVRHLVAQGFTVFMVSWANPGPESRDLGLEDYRALGVMAAIDAVAAAMPGRGIHAIGYCLGGTLLAIVAATMARDGDARLRSVALLAAQVDFSEAGELMLFVNESQLTFLEDLMWEQGFLDARQMAGAFQMLRSSDLVWSRGVRHYLMGERGAMTDLMAWNADATRMPYRMHTEYLRQLFLDNDLAEGRYRCAGRPVALSDIRLPVFAVGTRRDHVAPWRSVHKIHLLADAEVTFVLADGGHNAGIVAPPGQAEVGYNVLARPAHAPYADPDTWLAEAPRREGSWWGELVGWLAARSGRPVAPPRLASPGLGDAPGTHVLQE
ncbi:MAG: PHA/PHB synthase family protein [Alphaproteobacteria bacterium]|jgi:polyhydroxyalkanoate synthase